MRKTPTACTLALLIALAALPAAAQVRPDPEATVVEALTSSAFLKGPPWWKAEKAGRMVYILGLPTTVPRDLEFDDTLVGWRMDRAQRIILPAQYKTDVNARRFNLDAALTPDLRTRLAAARQTLGQPESRYARVNPLTAAARLSEDMLDHARLEWDAGYRGYNSLAARRLFTRKISTGLHGPLEPVNQETQLACLDSALAAVEAGAAAYRSAADAWAVGDIKGALTGPRGDRWWRCAADNTGIIARYVSEIESAVGAEGVEVVVAGIPVHTMVAQDGVVQRLQGLGYTITEPAALTETR